MKKWPWVLGVVVIVIVGGGWVTVRKVEQAATGKLVAQVLSDPNVQKELQNINVNQINQAIKSLTPTGTIALGSPHPGSTSAALKGSASHFAPLGSAPAGSSYASATASPSSRSTPATHIGASKSTNGGASSSSRTNPTNQSGAPSRPGSSSSPRANVSPGYTSGAATVPVFSSRQQVINFALSRFTQAQILQYAYLYAHRSSLTSAQKQQIKDQVMANFSPSQLAAMESAWYANP